MTKARFDSLSGDGITSGYNGFGELVSSQIVMGTLNKTLTYQYDANSKRTRLTHADAQAFTYARDQLGRVTNIYEGTGQVGTAQLIQAAYATPLSQDYATYTYSSSLKVLSMTGPRGYKAAMTYDGFDRQYSVSI